MRLVIVTGMSGAGKSNALNCMEDMGYFCVDNLPPSLIETFVQLLDTRYAKVAIGVDIRGGEFFNAIYDVLVGLRKYDVHYDILYLDASDPVLIKRFKETRRIHPLNAGLSLRESIVQERNYLQRIRENANHIVDTSDMTLGQLKGKIAELFNDEGPVNQFPISVVSFGFKYGIPADADVVFDVRFITNPFYIDTLKHHTGLDPDVQEYVMSFEETRVFLDKLYDMMDFLIPLYIKEGKGQLVVALGCTGGMHRSVCLAGQLCRRLAEQGYKTVLDHRDMERERARA